MKKLLAFVPALALLFACKEPVPQETDHEGGIVTMPSQRLMIYYPQDSLDANGDTVYHTIPDVALTAQSGKEFRSAAFRGKIVVADFFFASCQGICPVMNNQMSRVQKAFAGNPELQLVSYTVDPDRDSSQTLQRYADRFKADTAQWKFLTGQKKSIYDLARYGYFLSVEPGNGDSEDFIHSPQLVLLDRQSRVRGYYDGTDSVSVGQLIEDIGVLLKQK